MEDWKMRMTCVLCGKKTTPFAFIGNMAVGPRCARKANMLPTKIHKNALIRFTVPKKREAGPTTIDMFDSLKDDDASDLPVAR